VTLDLFPQLSQRASEAPGAGNPFISGKDETIIVDCR